MTTALAFLILIAPFAVAAALSWAAHRSDSLRIRFDQFRWSAPMMGRLFEDDRDGFRVAHDVDAIRSRFDPQPPLCSPKLLATSPFQTSSAL